MAAFRSALEHAIAVDDFIGCRDAFDYFRGVEEVIDAIECFSSRTPQASRSWRSEETVNSGVDDSAGYCADALARLVTLHLAACRKAKLPPDVLGPRLLALELASSCAEIEVVDRLRREAHQTTIGLVWQRFIGLHRQPDAAIASDR